MIGKLLSSVPGALATFAFVTGCGSDGKVGRDANQDAGAPAIQSGTTIETADGVVQGKTDGEIRTFFGIPYAKPPTGALRFHSPEPAESWTGKRDATTVSPACPQPGRTDTSEDCLTLNVWAPDRPQKELLPTMVWIHGGAFAQGSGSDYDGSWFVKRNVVLVTINYRLGALGFLAHEALSADPEGRGSSGNYGIEDQTLALEWVKKNARAFGGDPGNVTVFGESAGSACTCVLLGAPAARGLFHHAIMESGACLGFGSSLENAEAMGKKTAAAIGCDGGDVLGCLRGKTAEEIVSASSDLLDILLHQRYRPVVDGIVVPSDRAAFQKVPVIIGTNKNEGGPFGVLAGDEAAYTALVHGYYPGDPSIADSVLERYSVTKFGSASAAFSELITDMLFTCPSRRLARATSSSGMDTYVYNFTNGEAFHASEVPYLFPTGSLDESARPVSSTMLDFWTTFAVTGDPNGGTEPEWPKFDSAGDAHMILDTTSAASSGLKKEACDFADTLPPLSF